ncbi:MAG: winged helix-turn-helix transcriptional regulator [Chloroflexi bacterium]|nr:winged helix-turn-helix transcriptional regulator [Chloroflexota bacterium]
MIPQLDELNLLHSNICQAVGDPKRIQILYALYAQPQHVSALARELDMPQPTVSRHLALLRQRGLVVGERDGASVVYSLTDTRIIDVLDTMRGLLRDILERHSSVMD